MTINNTSIIKIIRQNRLSLSVYAGLLLVTLALLLVSNAARSLSRTAPVLPYPDSVQISGKLSQTKLVQGGQQTLYLDVNIKTPVQEASFAPQRATDMVIVLDRSGSMSEARKMNYAKAAISNIITQLNQGDRFALISFSDHSIVHTPLTYVDNINRHNFNNLLHSIASGGGTNMAEGLNAAYHLLSQRYRTDSLTKEPNYRIRKVLLLSDGHVNQGITDPNQLAAIAGRITETSSVLSTIGMGLDFNEVLMAKLADHGMGHYAYLEDLTGLSSILANNLNNTRNTFASASHLQIQLTHGVKILDAGGYPIKHLNSNTVHITTGQLLANANKNFVITISVPTDTLGSLALAQMHLNYQHQGQQGQSHLPNQQLKLAVLKPERRQEVTQSIDHNIYQQSWLKNNWGRMQKQLGAWIRSGDQDKAQAVIDDYRTDLKKAEAESNVPMASAALTSKLDEITAEVNEAFAGSFSDQQVKRKRAAKSMQYDAIKEQRKTK